VKEKDRPNINSFSGGKKFLLSILVIYLAVAVFNFHTAEAAVISFLKMFGKIIPILGIVFVAMIAINMFFTRERTDKYLGSKSGIMGWIYAVISGILLLGPPYVIYPLLGQLKKRGMRNAFLAIVLYNRNVKIPFLPPLIYYFGVKYTVVLSIYIIVFSILNGLLLEALLKKFKY